MGCGASVPRKLYTDLDQILQKVGNCTAKTYKGLWQLRRELGEGPLDVRETEDLRSDVIKPLIGGTNKVGELSVVEVLEIVVVHNSLDHPYLIGSEKQQSRHGIELARERVRQSGPGVQLRAHIVYPSGWITLANTGRPDVPIDVTDAPSVADMSNFWYSAEKMPAQHIWLKVRGCDDPEVNGEYRLCDNNAFGFGRSCRLSDYPVWRKARSGKEVGKWDRFLNYSKSKGAWTINNNGNIEASSNVGNIYYCTSSKVAWAGIDTPFLELKWDRGTVIQVSDLRKGANILVVEPGKGQATNIGQAKWVCHDGSAVVSFAGMDKVVPAEHMRKAEVLGAK